MDYLSQSSVITILVILWLSVYFIFTLWIFIYRYRLLTQRLHIESDSLFRLYNTSSDTISKASVLSSYVKRAGSINADMLKAAIGDTVRVSTKGLSSLSIISSTAPFIGLFGTVIGILETFGHLATQKSAALSVVAPAISEALIATAVGIFVAIFAYTFHLILKRKAYELSSVLTSTVDVVISKREQEI